ncbi:MAG: hypothetical protein ACLQA5_08995 [Solirubrobacteraceae bacterium]
MAEGGASDWSAKLIHDDLAGTAALWAIAYAVFSIAVGTAPAAIAGFAALGLGLAGVVPTLFRAGADQPGVSTGPATQPCSNYSRAPATLIIDHVGPVDRNLRG